MDFDYLHHFSNFCVSSEAFFKIPDATCKEIDAPSILGALAVNIFVPMPRNYRGIIFSPV